MTISRDEAPQGWPRTQSLFSSRDWSTLMRGLGLSPRQAEIVECILSLDDDEGSIADRLKISSHTVHTHLERLYRKLHVTSRCQLIARVFLTYTAARVGSESLDSAFSGDSSKS